MTEEYEYSIPEDQKQFIADAYKVTVEQVDQLWGGEDEHFLSVVAARIETDFRTRLEALKRVDEKNFAIYLMSVQNVNFLYYVYVETKDTPVADAAAQNLCTFATYKGKKYHLSDKKLEEVILYISGRENFRTNSTYTKSILHEIVLKALLTLKKYENYPREWVAELL